jgi:phytoene synthase
LSGQGRQQRLQLYYSFRFLPEDRRDAITALYAFCREVDDVVDECHDEGVARAKLAWWRGEVEKLYHGQPEHPVMLALKPHVTVLDLPQNLLEEIVDGMQMDLDFARYDRFQVCCCTAIAWRVWWASWRRRFSAIRIDRRSKYAHELGIAFQLTNIIRDVGEDAPGRIYLPVEELQRFNVPASDLMHTRKARICRADVLPDRTRP